MTRAWHFLRSISWPIAWHTGQLFLTIIGAFAVLGFLSAIKWPWAILTTILLLGVWYILYQFEFNYRSRRAFGGPVKILERIQ